ncbi:MAG: hypothetical protein WA736_08680 [Candidatus Acidiferrum sp.]
MKPDFAQYGFAHELNLIMAYIGGSQAHGAKLGATGDTDWYGLYIPPPPKVLGRRHPSSVLGLGPDISRSWPPIAGLEKAGEPKKSAV